jgi:hypothetical protein
MQQLEKEYAEKTADLNRISGEREAIRDMIIERMHRARKTKDKTKWGTFMIYEMKYWTYTDAVREILRTLTEKKTEERLSDKATYRTQTILILKPFIQRDWKYYKKVYAQRYTNRPEGVPTAH